MSEFFKKDKEKTVVGVAANDLWLKRGAIMLVVSLFLAFVAPSEVVSKSRAWILGLFGVRPSVDLSAEFKAVREREARRKKNLAYKLPGSGGFSLAHVFAPNSLVALDFESKLDGDSSLKGILNPYGSSVAGILSPKDSRKRGSGLNIAKEDVSGTRGKLANAGDKLSRAPAYAGGSFFSGTSAPAGDSLRQAFEGTGFPPTVTGVSQGPMEKGVTPKSVEKTSQAHHKQVADNRVPGNNLAMAQLADQHAGLLVADDPDISPEAAAAAGAAVFDGSRAAKETKNISPPTFVDGRSIPKIPSARDSRIAAEKFKKDQDEKELAQKQESKRKRRVRSRRGRNR